MLDALSDVIDWFGELKWDDGTALLVAVLMISTILWNMSTRWLRTRKRNKLAAFLDEARDLLNLCSKDPGPWPAYSEWTARVEAYLEKHLGHEKAVTFTSRAGLGAFDTEHSRNHALQALILTRQFRLQQFIDELSR